MIQKKPLKSVRAEKVAQRILASNTTPVEISHVMIQGDISIKYSSIRKAINIQNCTFTGRVDFLNCDFQQNVNFINCTFEKNVCFGEVEDAHTCSVFSKDIIFNGSTFHANASFVGITCLGSGYFNKAIFSDANSCASFGDAKFGSALILNDAVFSGKAIFNSLKCESGASYHRTVFDTSSLVDFTGSYFGKALECQGTLFKSPVCFESVYCGLYANFSPIPLFEVNSEYLVDESNKNKLKRAFRQNKRPASGDFIVRQSQDNTGQETYFIENNDKKYIAIANNDGTKYLISQRTVFDNPGQTVSFCYLTAGKRLYITQSYFASGYIDLSNLKCQDLFADNVTFRAGDEQTDWHVDFRHAAVDWILNCNNTTFEGPVIFNGVSCGGGGFFQGTVFAKNVDFSFSSFGKNLEMNNSEIKAGANFESIQVGDSFILSGSTLHDEISLKNARVKNFLPPALLSKKRSVFRRYRKPDVLENDFYFDFSGFEFKALEERDRDIWKRMVGYQKTAPYCKDIFIQLENYYLSIGDEAEASEIYYRGSCELRRQAFKRNSGVNWSFRKKISDGVLKYLTGYGVRNSRILIILTMMTFLGVLVYWDSTALAPVDPLHKMYFSSPFQKIVFQTAYSIDLLIPVLGLHIAENFKPTTFIGELYAFFHLVVGWILIPLFLASVTGIIKKREH